jgi:hypothetical protein
MNVVAACDEKNMKITIRKAVLCALAFGISAPIGLRAIAVGIQAYHISLAAQGAAQVPFTGVTAIQAEYMNCKLPANGNQQAANTRVRAVAADGSLNETIRFGSEVTGTIRRSDGALIKTYEHIKSKTSFQTSFTGPAVRASLRDPGTGCLLPYGGQRTEGEKKIGEDTLLGYPTIKTLVESSDRRRTSWMAPGLGCFEIQALLEFYDPKEPGKITGNSLIVTQSVAAGPPNPVLFESAGLVERKPSEIALENLTWKFRSKGEPEDKARELARQRVINNTNMLLLDTQYEQKKLTR